MKANELMRYDWVCLEDDNTPRQVDWIRSGEVGLLWNKIVTPPYLKPIRLTAEILEKNGWRGKSHTQWQFYRDGCDELNILLGKDYAEVEYLNMIYNPEDNAEINYGHNFEFPRTIYVHELQHALRLCGIEKEIEL